MASIDTPEPMPDADDDSKPEGELPEFTDRRGPLIVLAFMLLPPVILAVVELIRPAN